MTRTDHTGDPEAPKANSVVPAASAVVTDKDGNILLHRRADNGLWTIPGGRMEIGESISQAAVRETLEETGLHVRPLRVIGIYSDPRNVVEYENGEVRQQFSICFACEVVAGSLASSQESSEVGFFAPDQIEAMDMSSPIRQRIHDFLLGEDRAAFD